MKMIKLNIENYKPYKGFEDLREFDLSKRLFRKLWHIQDTLYEMSNKKEYYEKWHKGQWETAKQISAELQQILFQHKKREKDEDK